MSARVNYLGKYVFPYKMMDVSISRERLSQIYNLLSLTTEMQYAESVEEKQVLVQIDAVRFIVPPDGIMLNNKLEDKLNLQRCGGIKLKSHSFKM